MKKISRNDPCWCGSEKKYKKCHLGRESGKPHNTNSYINKTYQTLSRYEQCLGDSCSEKVIQAHSIQKARELKKIMDSTHHVLTFTREKPIPDKIGWNQASTFKGFCKKHDEIFSLIEKQLFIPELKQCALLSYRGLCTELHKKKAVKNSENHLRDVDRGQNKSTQFIIQTEKINPSIQGTHAGISDAEILKLIYEESLKTDYYEALKFLVISYKDPFHFAFNGGFTPQFNVCGEMIQDLSNLSEVMDIMLISNIIGKDLNYILLAWKSDSKPCNAFIDSLTQYDLTKLSTILMGIILTYIENFFFSESWWKSFSVMKRDKILRLVNSQYPSYERWKKLTNNNLLLGSFKIENYQLLN